MIAGLPLGFAQPLILLALISIPALWWLLRLVPPRPRRVAFPPTRILFDIEQREQTPARTPWWLTLLRLMLAALVIIAAAGPLWNPPLSASTDAAPLAVLIDNGWGAAATWDGRMRTAADIIARAETAGRGVALVPLAASDRDISLEPPGAARARLRQIKPEPRSIDRAEALPAIARFLKATPHAEMIWLADGIDVGNAQPFVIGLAKLIGNQPITVLEGGLKPARALAAADNAAGALTVQVLRAMTGGTDIGLVRALDLKGLPIGDARFAFRSEDRETRAQFDLPVEIRNDIARLEIADEHSAGAVQLLDKRWRRRTVGVISGASSDTAQPLLDAAYYLSRALNPFADVRLAEGKSPAVAVQKFLDQNLPMLILADVGNVAGEARDKLTKWIEEGGVLVRFAGPRLAAGDDDLVPVKLRRGGRTLGGSLTWEQPQQLGAFSHDGPFAGMMVPTDVTVRRQVLAEPDSVLGDHTWATLADGTPLVTAERRGKGEIVLFHVTADTRWSDLPLSGAFVEMLKRIVALSGSTAVAAEGDQPAAKREVVPPSRLLDGFGAFGPPSSTARPVRAGFTGRASHDHPPGFYGPPEGLLAVNTLSASDRLAPIDLSPLSARVEAYRVSEPIDLRGSIFLAALALLVADSLVVFAISGGIHRLMPRRGVAALVLVGALAAAAAVLSATSASADQASDEFALKATLETHLAYVVTGDPEVDAVSKGGLQGLTLFLAQRTALEAGEPIGVDIGRDDLAFFPLIYWPIAPGAGTPSAEALARADAYMKQGGTILFDTRDAVVAPPGPGGENRSPGMVALRTILSSLDLPELEPVPRDHVLTKTFFLLRDFPGRFTTGQLWVEATPPQQPDDEPRRPVRSADGVSSILITSNDLAGAWAIRPDGQPMLPLVPGDTRQREFAFRAGVNIVMYTLTGNYKADQVHIPALLERLGQ